MLSPLSSGDFEGFGAGVFVGEYASPDVAGDLAFEAPHGVVAGLPSSILRLKYRRPALLAMRTWVTTIRCSAEFSLRSPLRESRWVTRSPLDTSMGTTPA